MTNTSVLIAVPSTDSVHATFMMSLVSLVVATSRANIIPFGLFTSVGSVICANRTGLVDMALEHGASHILFLDTDMIFPDTLLDSLLAHNKDIVAINYVTKEIPAIPVSIGLGGERCTSVNKSGIESVLSIGLGGALIKTDVFKSLPLPWFDNKQLNDGTFRIDDGCFCENALAHGYEVFIDHTASQTILHRGGYNYGWGDC